MLDNWVADAVDAQTAIVIAVATRVRIKILHELLGNGWDGYRAVVHLHRSKKSLTESLERQISVETNESMGLKRPDKRYVPHRVDISLRAD
jgi:hypothetical protein